MQALQRNDVLRNSKILGNTVYPRRRVNSYKASCDIEMEKEFWTHRFEWEGDLKTIAPPPKKNMYYSSKKKKKYWSAIDNLNNKENS